MRKCNQNYVTSMNEMKAMSGSNHRTSPNANDPNSQISRRLREFYDSVQEQEIPDRFLDLLEKLDQVEKATKGADQNERE